MNPRRHSQIEKALQVLDKSSTVEILKDDQHLLFLFKKTERIVAAVYVITGLFSDIEPLKWGLRESGTVLLKHVLSFNERSTVQSKESLSDTFAEMAHLLSLIDLAYVADLVSPMNFSILKKEMESIQGIIEGKWRLGSTTISPSTLDESFFSIPKSLFPVAEIAKEKFPFSSSNTGETNQHNETLSSLVDLERLTRIRNKDSGKGHDAVLKRKHYGTGYTLKQRTRNNGEASVPTTDRVKENRKDRILSILRDKHTATIKDFSAVINGCSEKTIQRLLIDMVHTGVLKREGDRRWSKYSIALQV